MIPIVGLLVGVYTIIRMLEILLIRKEPRGSWLFLQIVSVLGILATGLLMVLLVASGAIAAAP